MAAVFLNLYDTTLVVDEEHGWKSDISLLNCSLPLSISESAIRSNQQLCYCYSSNLTGSPSNDVESLFFSPSRFVHLLRSMIETQQRVQYVFGEVGGRVVKRKHEWMPRCLTLLFYNGSSSGCGMGESVNLRLLSVLQLVAWYCAHRFGKECSFLDPMLGRRGVYGEVYFEILLDQGLSPLKYRSNF